MASASARAITPTHTGNFAQPTVAPDTPTSITSNPQTASIQATKELPQAAPDPFAAKASLRVSSETPKSPRTILSPPHAPLTGAAAMAEQRQLREKQQNEDARATSPNPGTTAIQSLLGQVTSSAKDAPAAVTNMSDPLAKIAKNIKIPEKANDPTQTSPISMSSFGSLENTTAPTVTAMEATAGPPMPNTVPPNDAPTLKAPAQDANEASANDSGNRAFTFPPPLDQDPRTTPQRGMSLPMSYSAQQQGTPQTRSPSISTGSVSSAKRHKCPYCSTDFTRHHNLKSHLLTHSQEKPYECPTCNARFRRLHDLKRHTKLHTGERPHTCPKCGRRFARGDALARHGKGVGGCAGRRSSFGAPGSAGDDDVEGMDGLEYSAQQTEEPERMDEDEAMEGDRRRSEPSREMQHHSQGASASTYPPIHGASRSHGAGSSRAMYPPPQATMTTNNTTSSSGREQSGPSALSAQSTTGSAPSVHFPPQQAPVFGQPGMTESPKPLSPGQEAHRSSLSAESAPGGRSLPGYTRSRGSSSVSLHPNPGPPQLPSLPGLNPQHTPSMLHQSIPAPQGPGSNAGSHSSHGQSSAGSMREVLGGGPSGGPDVWAIVRDLEGRLARMGDEYGTEIRRLKDEYGGEIRRLTDEVGFLRAQLGDSAAGREQQQQQQQPPPPPPPPPPAR